MQLEDLETNSRGIYCFPHDTIKVKKEGQKETKPIDKMCIEKRVWGGGSVRPSGKNQASPEEQGKKNTKGSFKK